MAQAKPNVETESREVRMKCAGYKNHPQGAEVNFPADEAAGLVAKGWATYVGGAPAAKTPTPEAKPVAAVAPANPPAAQAPTPTK